MVSVIIMDLGGVVLKEPAITLYDTLPSVIQEQLPSEGLSVPLFHRVFDFIHHVTQRDYKRDWFMGNVHGSILTSIVHEHIDNLKYKHFFHAPYEKLLIAHGASIILEPAPLAEYTQLFHEGIAFIEHARRKGLRVMVLSNWDPYSFILLQQKFSELFALFDAKDVFIPASIGHAKPEKEAFSVILEQHTIVPEQCLFIDDNERNVQTAHEYGMHVIQHNDWQITKKFLEGII